MKKHNRKAFRSLWCFRFSFRTHRPSQGMRVEIRDLDRRPRWCFSRPVEPTKTTLPKTKIQSPGFAIIPWNYPKKLEKPWITVRDNTYMAIFRLDFYPWFAGWCGHGGLRSLSKMVSLGLEKPSKTDPWLAGKRSHEWRFVNLLLKKWWGFRVVDLALNQAAKPWWNTNI